VNPNIPPPPFHLLNPPPIALTPSTGVSLFVPLPSPLHPLLRAAREFSEFTGTVGGREGGGRPGGVQRDDEKGEIPDIRRMARRL